MAGPTVGNEGGPGGSVAVPTTVPASSSTKKSGGSSKKSGSSTNGDASLGLLGERNPPYRNSPNVSGANGPIDIYTGARLYRGNFREYYDPGERQPPASKIYHLDFFYNPASIEVDYSSVNLDSYTPIDLTQTQLEHQTLANIQNLNSVSWSMIIDRTGVPDSETPDQAVPEGVLRDVRIFEKILTQGWGGPNQYGYRPLAMTRVRFSRHGGGRQPPLNYIGYISAASVQYTRFNIDMVPTRCELDVTMSITVMQPELWIDSGGEAGYTVKSLGRVGTPLNPYDTGDANGTLYLPGAGTRRSFLPGTSSTDTHRALPSAPAPNGPGAGPGAAGAAVAVGTAQAQVGKPYVFGAGGPNSFDCSGLTQYCWKAAGVNLPHNADQQYHSTFNLNLGDELPGDIAFFGSTSYVHHCGLVVAPGQMIEAPHTGANVRASGYHRSDLVAFGRPSN